MKSKPMVTTYPEFTDDSKTWRNPPRPSIDGNLVKELEAIARCPKGARYKLEWMPDVRVFFEDQPEINENGLIVGIERGGWFHDDAVCIFDQAAAYKYTDARGFTRIIKTENKADAPEGVILEAVIETVSIGIPRFRVVEWLDKETSPLYGDGDYFEVWKCEEITITGETDEHFLVTSEYRPFSAYDLRQAKNLYSERQNLTKTDKILALEKEAADKLDQKRASEAAHTKEMAQITEKFFCDREYKATQGVTIYAGK